MLLFEQTSCQKLTNLKEQHPSGPWLSAKIITTSSSTVIKKVKCKVRLYYSAL